MSILTVAEREEIGRAARTATPRSSHGEWAPGPGRRDPVELLGEQNATRVEWLVPVRHSRMSASPFTFYRGTARIMAADLAHTPTSGLDVQLIGDGHLSNFGAYASPERRLVFDANDFDETLRGPWEWDLKRLATSFTIAARHLGFSRKDTERTTTQVVRVYGEAMAEFAEMGFMELWYQHTGVQDFRSLAKQNSDALGERLAEFERRARSKNSLQALSKLATVVDGSFRIRTDRPVLVPLRDVLPHLGPEEIETAVRESFDEYVATLRDDRKGLIARYELVDIALKVVGVGSVGTRCFILLLEGRDEGDPLFLQVKEAGPSVLEEYLHPSRYTHHGQRVVEGQRQIQAQSDICLGWTTGREGRKFYVRQLRDWKRSYDVESSDPQALGFYAKVCGFMLARGHARSGDPAAIAGYIGSSDTFERSMVAFARAYAAQNDEDYERFLGAIADGEIPSGSEV